MPQTIQLPWEQPDWLEQATAWINAQVAKAGWHTTGPVELVHQRPWSTFAKIPTDHGIAYFKAPSPMFKFEATLTEALARWRPDVTVPLLAFDLDRGWLLSSDAGVTLRSLTQAPDQIDHWLKLLPRYVEFQIEMADRVPELLALGLPDRRLAVLPHLYNQLLEDKENLLIGLEGGLTPEEYQRLLDLRPHYANQCAQLAAYGLPETLTHEEIHENNVLFRDGHYTFTDWSDCSVGHPFFSMLVTLRSIAHWLKLDEDGPDVRKVRDAYLEPWTTFETRPKLNAALDLAYRLAMVNRALSWHLGTGTLAQKDKADYTDNVPGWLQDYLIAEAGRKSGETNDPVHEENTASRLRLETFAAHLSDEDLARTNPHGWTVAALLAHLAFWDQRMVVLLRRWKAHGVDLSPADPDMINDALLPLCLALDPRKAVELCLSSAREADAEIAATSPELYKAIEAAPVHFRFNRALHRNNHLNEIEKLL